ncbi:MAG: hypothetical protein ABMA02_07365 [Saprospiraceae bacterium]
MQLDSTNNGAHYNLACLYSYQNRVDEAYKVLETALKNNRRDFEEIQQDPDPSLLRKRTEQWKALLKKHFPDKVKD